MPVRQRRCCIFNGVPVGDVGDVLVVSLHGWIGWGRQRKTIIRSTTAAASGRLAVLMCLKKSEKRHRRESRPARLEFDGESYHDFVDPRTVP